MFKLYLLLCIATLSLFPHLSDAVCCRTATTVFFKTKDDNCGLFGAQKTPARRCAMPICGDGQRLRSGLFCGVGRCNIFGCNCDGGCRLGDAIKNFKNHHGDKVYNVYEYSPGL